MASQYPLYHDILKPYTVANKTKHPLRNVFTNAFDDGKSQKFICKLKRIFKLHKIGLHNNVERY